MDAIKTTAAGLTVKVIGKTIQWWEDEPVPTAYQGVLVSARHYKRGKASLWVELKIDLGGDSGVITMRVRPNAVFFITTKFSNGGK